ncbi:hypothetical protein LCGC14_1710260, partial [marine sediment metagenome]
MADIINYPNLFDRLKLLLKYFNILETRQSGTGATDLPLPYIKNQILVPYEAQDLTSELPALENDFEATISAIESLKLAIVSYFEFALANIASSLGSYNESSPEAVLNALAAAMTRDAETINARELIVNASDVASDLTIAPHASNVGTGRLIYSFIRNGLSPSEIAFDEVLQCICTSSTTLKQEVFQLSGEMVHDRVSHLGQGSGLGPVVVALGESLTNGDFEDWTTNAADNWTATVGAWNTEIIQNASNPYEGSSDVKTAYAQGDWKITHAIPITLLPNTIYVVALWAKKDTSATGTLRFGISNGTAVDVFVSGCVKSIDITTLTTAFVLQFLTFKTPTAVDSTWTIGISSDTPAVADFYFDLC